MKNKFAPVDLNKVKTFPIKKRKTKSQASSFAKPLPKGSSFAKVMGGLPKFFAAEDLKAVAKAIVAARKAGKPVIAGIGAHVIKCGLSPLLIDLMNRGFISLVAMNGAGAIHDFEVAYLGRTSEDVGPGLEEGKFGMVRETAEIMNEAMRDCLDKRTGLGDAIAQMILHIKAPHSFLSLLASGKKLGRPPVVFVAIGTDTIHMHGSFSGAAAGEGSHTDFRTLVSAVSKLGNGGVYLNIGSAVILPEVFLKALTVARNIHGRVNNFTTANFDMIPHYRPGENVIKRPTAGGGKGFNIIGRHEIMLPLLYQMIIEEA